MNKYISLAIILSTLTISLFSQNKPLKVGSDKDKHGCIGSAGYVYSVIKNDCIRVFEQNLKLSQVNPKGSSTSIAAVIFSKDSLKAEVFLPGFREGQILSEKSSKGFQSWSNGGFSLISKNGFQLFKGKTLLFSLK